MKSKPTRRDGFALVSVLLFLLVVTAVITPFVLAARTDFLLASAGYHKDRQTHLADGLARLVARQVAAASEEINEELRFNSEPMRSVCGNSLVEVRVQDQLGLVNLNLAGADLLAAGFSALGFDSSDSSDLAALAETYRNQEGAASPAAERDLSDGFKFGSFEAIEELYEFPGFARQSVELLGKVFTIHGGLQTINATNVPAALKKEIGRFSGNPLIVDVNPSESRHFRISILARSVANQAIGFSEFVIEVTDGKNAAYKVLERGTDPGVVGDPPAELPANMRCHQIFGEEVSEWLAAV